MSLFGSRGVRQNRFNLRHWTSFGTQRDRYLQVKKGYKT